jgi:hypothetical protein
MTKIDFYKLSRPIQDGLLDSFGGQFTPAPILVRPGARSVAAVWLRVAAVAAALLAALPVAGFGDVASSLALHPAGAAAVYAALAATVVISVLNAAAHRAEVRALPFPAGVFLFPANVIDARRRVLRVYPLDVALSVSADSGRDVVVTFADARFVFPVADRAVAEEAVSSIEATRSRMREPLLSVDRRRVDPLAPPSVVSPLASDVPLSQPARGWLAARLPIGLVVGGVLGVALFSARNAMSDARMLAWAKSRDDVASYRSYLARGRANEALVRGELLPRAALRAAIQRGSVEAIDGFTHEFPDTRIGPEVVAARQAALAAEFERARAVGTFPALLAFAERYPDHGIQPGFDNARHALYAASVARHRKDLTDEAAEFAGRVAACAERAGLRKTAAGYRGLVIQVRFRRQPSKEMERADDAVRKSPSFNGTVSLPSTHLGAQRFAPHEKSTADEIAQALGKAFDPELATFERGPPLDATDAQVAALPTPTLVVSYRVESSGAAYASRRPQGIFLGIVFFFNAEFILPKDSRPMRTPLTLVQKIPFGLLKDDAAPAPGMLEPSVYEEMTKAGFADLQSRYLARWFSKTKP